MKGNIGDELTTTKKKYNKEKSNITYCSLMNISVESFSGNVRDVMEKEMKAKVMDIVKAVHPYSISYGKDGRYRTKVKTKDGKKKSIAEPTEDRLYQMLYEHYYGEERFIFEKVFEQVCENALKFHKVRDKTISEYKKCYKYFYEGTAISKLSLKEIGIRELVEFLDEAHTKISKKDIERGQTCIELHRHREIKTIFDKVFAFANTRLCANVNNPFLSIAYNEWPYYDQSNLEHDYYSIEDRKKLLTVFDSIENPTLYDLCVGFIFETSTRNGEARAIRFCDFHFDAEIPYVRICGKAENGYREERVKKDSKAGKRNLVMTNRLRYIYNKAKELSWSDTYMFVKDKEYARTDNYLINGTGVCRALERMCKEAGIKYLSPHQIRFSDATIMAYSGRSGNEIESRLGNKMGTYYVREIERQIPIAGPSLVV